MQLEQGPQRITQVIMQASLLQGFGRRRFRGLEGASAEAYQKHATHVHSVRVLGFGV